MSPRLTATARREQILDVALEVFATHGFHGASMNEVAEAVGVTKPVLYQHFDSKRDLYQALIDEVGDRLLGEHREGCSRGHRWQEPDRTRIPRLLPLGCRGPRRVPIPVRIGHPPRRRVQCRRHPNHRRGGQGGGSADRRRHRRAPPHHDRPLAGGHGRGREPTAGERGDEFDPDEIAHVVADLAWAGLRAVQPKD